MTSNPDESSHSPSNPSPAGSSSVSSRDWVLVLAKILFLLALVLIVMPMYEVWQMSEQVLMDESTDLDVLTDLDALNVRHKAYLVTGFCLIIVAATVTGVRQFKLQPDQALVASRLLDVPQFGGMSMNDIQKKGGTKIIFAWLWDYVLMIAVVFTFALGACMNSNTHPIFAAVCLTFAILYPSMAEVTRRQREAIFGVPSRDESP